MARRKSADGGMSLRFVAHWEERIAKQEQLIAELRNKGQSTNKAEGTLKTYKETLIKLRNHADLMQDLMRQDPRENNCKGGASLQFQLMAKATQGSQVRRTS
jgi:hypothetical protein